MKKDKKKSKRNIDRSIAAKKRIKMRKLWNDLDEF